MVLPSDLFPCGTDFFANLGCGAIVLTDTIRPRLRWEHVEPRQSRLCHSLKD